MDFREAQSSASAAKQRQGFSTADVPLESGLLHQEPGEAFSASRKGQPHLAEERADAAIFLLGLAEMTGHDLQAEVEAKPGKNARRGYGLRPNGTLVKRGRQMEAGLDGGLRR